MDEMAEHPVKWEVPEKTLSFEFTGSAREYFGIWIVNLLLSIVTLGIYTAWAKVRRLRYFYGNTWLDGHNFEYHARPKQILIGRLIVFGALIAINTLVNVHPLFALLFLPYLLAFPWLINKSMAFNARMTSYRNVRLNFRGTYWGAFAAFIAAPMLATFSFGLAAPVASHISSNYIGKHLGYGTSRFETDAPIGKLYRNLGVSILFGIGMAIIASVIGLMSYILYVFAEERSIFAPYIWMPGDDMPLFMFLQMRQGFAILVGLIIGAVVANLFYQAGVRNVAFNATRLDAWYRLTSKLGRRRYVWILVSNLFVTIFTLGMMRPWAGIRTWRFFAAGTALIAEKDLEGFSDEAAPEGNVAAAEFFDIEGIDFGL